jgi:hypothetical protein
MRATKHQKVSTCSRRRQADMEQGQPDIHRIQRERQQLQQLAVGQVGCKHTCIDESQARYGLMQPFLSTSTCEKLLGLQSLPS